MNNSPLKNYDEELMNIFIRQNIKDYVLENYECLGGYWVPEDQSLNLINRKFYASLFDKFS